MTKQSEITALRKDSARLATELAESCKQAHLEQQRAQKLVSRATEIELRLTDQCMKITCQVHQYREELVNAAGKLEGLSKQEQLNTALKSRLAALEQLINSLREALLTH